MNPNAPETCRPCCHPRWRRAIGHVLAALALGLVLVTGFSWLVKLLWNGLMPQLFNLHPITYCQAFGLLLLGRLLFGGFHHGHHRRRHGRPWKHRRCRCGNPAQEGDDSPEVTS